MLTATSETTVKLATVSMSVKPDWILEITCLIWNRRKDGDSFDRMERHAHGDARHVDRAAASIHICPEVVHPHPERFAGRRSSADVLVRNLGQRGLDGRGKNRRQTSAA